VSPYTFNGQTISQSLRYPAREPANKGCWPSRFCRSLILIRRTSSPSIPRRVPMYAWIDSNRGTKRRKRGRKTASKPMGSIAPQSTAPTKRSRKRTAAAPPAPAQPNPVTGAPLRVPYGNKKVALKLGARYGSAGWYAPPGVDLAAFGERGWL
jgi:hypothetical protein